MYFSNSLGLFGRDNQRANVITALLIMFVMRSVAIGKLFAFPTSAKDTFVAHVFDINGVDDFAFFLLDSRIAGGWFESGHLLELILKRWASL